uniref:Uncharacterized protein n=1 Tax=Opuntia streptacantha TaxID=393608 RepID=A0A7C8ZNL2_OPUST
MPDCGGTKTDDRALAEALGVSSSVAISSSSRPHPPSSSSSVPSPSSKPSPISPFPMRSTSCMSSSSPQSPSPPSSSSSAAPLPTVSSPPSNIPFITLNKGQSPPHITGAGGIRRAGAFPLGKEGTLSPSSAARRSAIS